jgi:hypothetical protein
MKAAELADRRTWKCPYCTRRDIPNRWVDATDHLLDEHREILVKDKPVIVRAR